MLFSPVPPSEPLDVSVVAVNERNVLVSWKLPTQTGSPALTGYKLCFNGTCDMDVKEERAEVGGPHLKENECYNIIVYAVSESDCAGRPVEDQPREHVWTVTGITKICTMVVTL